MAKKDTRKRIRSTTFSITTRLYPDNNGSSFFTNPDFFKDTTKFPLDNPQMFADNYANAVLNNILYRLQNNNAQTKLSNMFYIVHDKDLAYPDSQDDPRYKDVPKPPHIHMVVNFTKRVEINVIHGASMLVNASQIEQAKGGRYALENMLAYLIHAKDPDKYHYDPKEVKFWNGNELGNYEDYYEQHKEAWKKRSATVTANNGKADLDWIISEINQGNLTKENLLLTDSLRIVYAQNKRKIDDALNVYSQAIMAKAMNDFKAGGFTLKTLFFHGKAGAGKTTVLKAFANSLLVRHPDWQEPFWGGATDSLQDYKGQEIIILDDVRAQSMSASDWVKLLDPYNVSPTAGRYHNKTSICHYLFISAIDSPMKFFSYTKSLGADEPLDQFIRRLSWSFEVIDADQAYSTYASGWDNPFFKPEETLKGQMLLRAKATPEGRAGLIRKPVKLNEPEKQEFLIPTRGGGRRHATRENWYAFSDPTTVILDGQTVQQLVANIDANNSTITDVTPNTEQ